MNKLSSTKVCVSNGRIEEICKFCKNDCHGEIKFSQSIMQRWGLETPMCLPCAIEALIDKKIGEWKE